MMKQLILSLVICEFSLACASAADDPNAHCDALIERDLHDVYSSLDETTAKSVRLDVEGSTYTWSADENRNAIRKRVSAAGASDYVRLEVGRSPGTRYNSLWYVARGSKVEEFSTGAEGAGVKRREVSDNEWRSYKARLAAIAGRGLPSRVSSTISDAPVYFFCAHVDGRDHSFVLEEFPDTIPQYQLILDTFRLSGFKRVPRELSILVDP